MCMKMKKSTENNILFTDLCCIQLKLEKNHINSVFSFLSEHGIKTAIGTTETMLSSDSRVNENLQIVGLSLVFWIKSYSNMT